MGEQESFSSFNSNPVYIIIMRNSRGKLFVYVAVLGVLCFIVFLLSSTHTSLKELESVNEKCQQQRDSLSAQLQVVYEHKNRLEKSLQQEKTDHRHTKEENEKQLHQSETKLQEEKDKAQKLEAQITQLKTSYSELEDEKAQSENALTEQLKTVQGQKDKEIEKLQNHITELLTEKDKLEMSNNAKVWKIEQQSSELKFCHLQHDQTKIEFSKCQEQLQKYNQNIADNLIHSKIAIPERKAESDNTIKLENEHPQLQIQADVKEPELKEQLDNKTASPPSTEKKVLVKPHIMPPNNAADGVLPKPVDDKIEDVDAAVEVPEMKKGEKDAKLLHVNQRDTDNKINLLHEEKKENNDALLKPDVAHKEQENHPQVLPPNNFDIGEKDDHAAERGEYGPQYGLPEGRQQVEIPAFNSKHGGKRKNMMPLPQQMNNDIAAQMQDMMNKSPGDVNNFEDPNAMHMPQQGFGAIEDKIREFKNADGLLRRGGDPNGVMDEKNYEEDDDDRENDDDQVNGVAPEMKGVQVLQDNDFDDQDNQENVDNAKEEGVVVAPK